MRVRKFSVFFFLILCIFARAEGDPVERLTDEYRKQLEDELSVAVEKRQVLDSQFLTAVKKEEEKLQNQGDLDGLLEVKKFRETFEEANIVSDPPVTLKSLVEIYLNSLRRILKDQEDVVTDLGGEYAGKADELTTQLTKQGDIDAAVKAKSMAEKFRQGTVVMRTATDTTEETQTVSTESRLMPVPKLEAPIWTEESPFDKIDEWPELVTLPVAKYRFDGNNRIKEGGKGIVIQEGSSFIGKDDRTEWFVSRRKVVANGVDFNGLHLRGGLNSVLFFKDCEFEDVTIGKADAWFAGNFMSKWQFRDCNIKGSLLGNWVPNHTGLQMYRCTVERVDFSPITYQQEPSHVALHSWAMILNTHFRKCEIPQSMLSLMENCSFEGCFFVEDVKPLPDFENPVHRVLYIDGGSWKIKNSPNNLTFERKPLRELPR